MLLKATSRSLQLSRSQTTRNITSLLRPVFGGANHQNPLTEEFPGLPPLDPTADTIPALQNETVNGTNVLVEESNSPVATVGVVVNLGTRNETPSTLGATHMLRKMLVGSSTNQRSALRIKRELEDIGATVRTQLGREEIVIYGKVMAQHTSTFVDILGNAITDMRLARWEVEEMQEHLQYDLEEQSKHLDLTLNDCIHAAAFYDTESLGKPLHDNIHSNYSIDSLNAMYNAFDASNTNVVALGVNSNTFCDSLSASFNPRTSNIDLDRSEAEFVGGEYRIRTAGGGVSLALGFPVSKSDTNAAYVLSTILGGGSNASLKRSLGDGSISRLNENVVQANSGVSHASAFCIEHSDISLIGVQGTTYAEDADALAATLAKELNNAAQITDEECTRAKNVIKGSIQNSQDSQDGRLSNIISQIKNSGSYSTPEEQIAAFDKVTVSDVQAVAIKALQHNPALAAVGNLNGLSRHNKIADLVSNPAQVTQ